MIVTKCLIINSDRLIETKFKTFFPSAPAPCGHEHDDNWGVLTSHLISPALWGSKITQPERGAITRCVNMFSTHPYVWGGIPYTCAISPSQWKAGLSPLLAVFSPPQLSVLLNQSHQPQLPVLLHLSYQSFSTLVTSPLSPQLQVLLHLSYQSSSTSVTSLPQPHSFTALVLNPFKPWALRCQIL